MKTIIIGRVLKPHGLKGEIKVEPITDDLTQFTSLKKIYIDNVEYKVTSSKVRQGFIYCFLDGINDCDQVEKLRNKFVARERTGDTNSQGEYYQVDLMSCNIVDDKGKLLGKVTSLDDYGSATVVTYIGKLGEFSFPFVMDDIVTSVDLSNNIIYVNSQRLNEVQV